MKRAKEGYKLVSDIFTPSRIALLAVVLLIGIVGLFGGWDVVGEEAGAPRGDLEEAAEVKPFKVLPETARYFDEIERVLPKEEGYRYIALMVNVENTSDSFIASNVLTGSVTIDIDGLKQFEAPDGSFPVSPQVIRVDDALNQRAFQPGLPVRVILVWQQESGVEPSSELAVTFSANTWRRSTLDEQMAWLDPEPAVQYVLPLSKAVDE
ncbi:hypothetical protein U6G28_09995 [Actinomycetaceae bacterium MB13-C1-2]|nr:hypothetical protein U6G28_09995 [Actinomycetaceae bacterium MB13-C1-2]